MPQSTVTEMPFGGPRPQRIDFTPLGSWRVELLHDALTIFERLREVAGEIGRLVGHHGRTEAGAA
jgi:hypothetical protein